MHTVSVSEADSEFEFRHFYLEVLKSLAAKGSI